MTLAVDFDGVLHAYTRGWADGTCYDPPLPGAIDGLRALMDRDAVFIHTTRDPHQVADWLRLHAPDLVTVPEERDSLGGTFWNERGVLLITDRKYPARAYLDDRAVRFTDWASALNALIP